MRNAVVWNVRDARGLNQDEKALLWAIESRGTCETTWQRLAADAGDMTKDRFYRSRKSLVAKSLIRVVRKYNEVSEYCVDAEALSGFVPDSHSANEGDDDSHSENGHSHSANEDSHMTETKMNRKKNRNKNITSKKNTTAPVVADATTVPGDNASSLPKEDEKGSVPTMGRVGRSQNGDYLFEVEAGSGRYLLCGSGVTGPVPLSETGDAATDEESRMRAESWARIERTRAKHARAVEANIARYAEEEARRHADLAVWNA